MRVPRHTKSFRRDYRKLKHARGQKMRKLHAVMEKLIDGATLPSQCRDHALHGEWQGCHDCHIEGDWVLVYELEIDAGGREMITFHATGNHEYLFG